MVHQGTSENNPLFKEGNFSPKFSTLPNVNIKDFTKDPSFFRNPS